MKCTVLVCTMEATDQPGGSDRKLCEYHWKAWGYWLIAYRTALGKNDARVRNGLWRKAFDEFLEHCEMEINALMKLREIFEVVP